MLPVTALYAGPITLILIWLSARVIVYRRANRLSLGDDGDRALLYRMRAQANCAEYAPLGVVLLGIAELNGTPAIALHILGLILLAGRMTHAWGFTRTPHIMKLRVIGMVLTFTMLGTTAAGLFLHAVL